MLKYSCEPCFYSTNRKNDYNKHLKTVKHIEQKQHPQEEYKCEKCNFFTKRKIDYDRHLQTNLHAIRTEPQSYLCFVCFYKTQFKPDIKKHYLETKHQYGNVNQITYECKINNCDFKTKNKRKYKTHQLKLHAK
jgi:hypothetical protein